MYTQFRRTTEQLDLKHPNWECNTVKNQMPHANFQLVFAKTSHLWSISQELMNEILNSGGCPTSADLLERAMNEIPAAREAGDCNAMTTL